MSSIELVISDIDGTLIRTDGTVSPATRAEIHRVTEQGVHFAVASGRPTGRVRDAVEGLNVLVPIISSNGATIEDLNTGEIIHSVHMEHEIAQEVLRVIRDNHGHWVFCDTSQGWICQAGDATTAVDVQDWIDELDATWVEDWSTHLEEGHRVRKVVVHGEESELERLEEALQNVAGVHVTSSWENNREIIVAGAHKANAAKLLAARLHIDPTRVLALGDNRNDMELLEWAGVSVAMGNAVPELKQVADWVTTTNDEDGVATALAHFIP